LSHTPIPPSTPYSTPTATSQMKNTTASMSASLSTDYRSRRLSCSAACRGRGGHRRPPQLDRCHDGRLTARARARGRRRASSYPTGGPAWPRRPPRTLWSRRCWCARSRDRPR
jgi:hypothetical protein